MAVAGRALAQLPVDEAGSAPGRERGGWIVTPSLKVAETYSDNVFLSPDGSQQSDWITQLIPGIALRARGPRLRVDASYAPEIVHYKRAERAEDVFHRGNALGTLEVADELLFLEAGAKVDQYDVSLQGPQTTSNINITGNRATATTAHVSPYLLRHIGSAARAEARFTYSAWQSDDSQRILPDNTARRVHLRLANGPAYRQLTWDAAYSKQSIEYDTEQRTTSEKLTASGERRITSVVSLLALAGYERYETGSDTLAEPRWSAGLGWTPTSRTRLAVTAGRRLDSRTYGLDFNHRTRLTAWKAAYAEDVTTSREQFFVPATQSTAGTLDQMFLLQYPDPVERQQAVQDFIARTGLASTLDAPLNLLSDRLFLQKRWVASTGLRGARNTLVASAFWELRELVGGAAAPTGDFATSDSVRTAGGSLAWSLRLTARSTLNVQASYSRSKFVDNGEENDFVSLQAGVTRQLQPRVSGSVHYRLQERDSNRGGVEYRENTVVASILMAF